MNADPSNESQTKESSEHWYELAGEIQTHLFTLHEKILNSIIRPVLILTSIFLVVSHLESSVSPFLSIGLLLAILGFNIYLTTIDRIWKTPWGLVESRSDEVDTVRWCLNFFLYTALFWSLDMHPASVVIIWTLLSVGAISVIQNNNYQLLIIVLAVVSFVMLVFSIYTIDLKTQIYVLSCYLAIVFVSWKMKSFLIQEMNAFFTERIRREKIEAEALELHREAAIGYSTRAINHEMHNLIGIAISGTDTLRNTKGAGKQALDRMDAALDYMLKVSSLVLDDLGSKKATNRMLSLAQLQNDIQMLLGQNMEQNAIAVHIDFPANADDLYFEERRGATYLIIHNLVKNALEAVADYYKDTRGGVVEIVAKTEPGLILLDVMDNGSGLSSEQIDAFKNSESISTTKAHGHGLGLAFVRRECELNNYTLNVSKRGIGVRISLLNG